VRTVLCKDAHHLPAAADSGCNENAHLMCERSNYGRVLVAAEVMELWRRSGDGLALWTHAPLATERRPHVPVCPSVGGNLGELSAGDLPQQDFRGVRGCTSTSRAFYVKWRSQCGCGCRPTPEEHIPSGSDRVRVALFTLAIAERPSPSGNSQTERFKAVSRRLCRGKWVNE